MRVHKWYPDFFPTSPEAKNYPSNPHLPPELHLSVKIEASATLDFWHTSVGVVYANCILGL